ncbi:VOC family protein [Streptomyces sanglieri]|uniref:VOC family protein n=1 Tax=Streptomyces sanglieri TaxID=193460 RepID=A0ABW2X389_9ACTN
MTATSVRGIDHIGVTVPDLETATLFLTRAFGAEVLYDTLRRQDGPNGGPDVERRLGVPAGTQQLAVRMLALPGGGPGIELCEFEGPVANPGAALRLRLAARGAVRRRPGRGRPGLRGRGRLAAGRAAAAAGPRGGEHNRFAYLRTPWGSTLQLLTYPDPQPWERTATRRSGRPAQAGAGTWPTDPARPGP